MSSETTDIDFVITYVDNADPRWQREYEESKSGQGQAADTCRFRDWGWMRYWFRAVEMYAPWVRTVWLVVAYESQVPEWLDRENPKLNVVLHEDYIPKEYLPTFNSHTIELNLHRIEGLAEHFVYFNDDMFLNAPVSPEYYFRDGLPCDATQEQPLANPTFTDEDHWGIRRIAFNNVALVNRHFVRRNVVKDNLRGWYGLYQKPRFVLGALLASSRPFFSGFTTPHVEKPLLKSVFLEIWEAESDWLNRSCSQFRDDDNVSIYVVRLWQLASNKFKAVRTNGKQRIDIQSVARDEIRNALMQKNVKSLCLNDTQKTSVLDFYDMRIAINDMMMAKFPKKSLFEKK